MSLNQPNVFSASPGTLNPAVPVTIANGAQNSSILECKGYVLAAILIPAAFTSTTLTFLASINGTNFYEMYNTYSGTALSYVVAAGRFVAINPADFQGVNYLKIVAGSDEGAARTLYCALKRF